LATPGRTECPQNVVCQFWLIKTVFQDAANAQQRFTGVLCKGCLMNPQPTKRRLPHSLAPGGSKLKYRANQKTITIEHLHNPSNVP
jgi:hypothetical protein